MVACLRFWGSAVCSVARDAPLGTGSVSEGRGSHRNLLVPIVCAYASPLRTRTLPPWRDARKWRSKGAGLAGPLLPRGFISVIRLRLPA